MGDRRLDQAKYARLAQLQSLDLESKVRLAEVRIREWYERHDGLVYVSFSGEKDSTVLLHLARSLYPDIPAVFVDTGLEYPEVRRFVLGAERVTRLRPAMPFRRVVERYGYPLVSKKIADYIDRVQRSPNPAVRERLLHGRLRSGARSRYTIPIKWQHLVDSGIRIGAGCCKVFKERPLDVYGRESHRAGIVGTMAADSVVRKESWVARGCNAYTGRTPLSRPLSVWTTADVWAYIRSRSLVYSPIYDVGQTHGTGCFACMFGVHMKQEPNRFQRMRVAHPKLWRYCFEFLRLDRPLGLIGVPWE